MAARSSYCSTRTNRRAIVDAPVHVEGDTSGFGEHHGYVASQALGQLLLVALSRYVRGQDSHHISFLSIASLGGPQGHIDANPIERSCCRPSSET